MVYFHRSAFLRVFISTGPSLLLCCSSIPPSCIYAAVLSSLPPASLRLYRLYIYFSAASHYEWLIYLLVSLECRFYNLPPLLFFGLYRLFVLRKNCILINVIPFETIPPRPIKMQACTSAPRRNQCIMMELVQHNAWNQRSTKNPVQHDGSSAARWNQCSTMEPVQHDGTSAIRWNQRQKLEPVKFDGTSAPHWNPLNSMEPVHHTGTR